MAAELQKLRLPVLTNSAMRVFRRCAREYSYAYEHGYRPLAESDETLRFGTLMHSALEAWWLAGEGRQLDAAIEALRPLAADEYDLVRAGVLMQGYDARWASEQLDVIAVERQFRAPLVNPETGAASRTFELAGKLDAIVRDQRDGLVKLVEHKTTARDIGVGSLYWKQLTLDAQVSLYFAGAKASGHEIAECIYDVIGKPALRPHKATPEESRKYTKDGRLYANQRAVDETPDEFRARLTAHVAKNPDRYYQRGTVVRLEQEELDAAYDTWSIARLIREAQLADRWPRNVDACERFGRMCAYWPVCSGEASIDDETRYARIDNVHVELDFEAA